MTRVVDLHTEFELLVEQVINVGPCLVSGQWTLDGLKSASFCLQSVVLLSVSLRSLPFRCVVS